MTVRTRCGWIKLVECGKFQAWKQVFSKGDRVSLQVQCKANNFVRM